MENIETHKRNCEYLIQVIKDGTVIKEINLKNSLSDVHKQNYAKLLNGEAVDVADFEIHTVVLSEATTIDDVASEPNTFTKQYITRSRNVTEITTYFQIEDNEAVFQINGIGVKGSTATLLELISYIPLNIDKSNSNPQGAYKLFITRKDKVI